MALAATARFEEAQLCLRQVEQRGHAELLPLLQTLIELYRVFEYELSERVRTTVLGVPASVPGPLRIPFPPVEHDGGVDAPGDLLKHALLAVPKVLNALRGLDVLQDDESALRLRLHPWVLEHYGMPRLQKTSVCLLSARVVPEGEGIPEAVIAVANGYLAASAVPMTELRGATAGLPSVLRAAAYLAVQVALLRGRKPDGPELSAPHGADCAAAISAALALPLSEEELLAYALLTVNIRLPDHEVLIDQITVRWRELHGATLWLALFRVERLLASNIRDQAAAELAAIAADQAGDDWVRRLQARLAH
jgi:hypothetical protein